METSLLAGWIAALAAAALLGATELGAAASLAVATASLTAAFVALPPARDQAPHPPPLRYELPLRMAAFVVFCASSPSSFSPPASCSRSAPPCRRRRRPGRGRVVDRRAYP